MECEVLLGNGAIARGIVESGCRLFSAYPGTPSSEILSEVARFKATGGADLWVEWATNEKVALEMALAASYAGMRAATAMKQVGLNVASDPLISAAYTGVVGGLVVVVADDPRSEPLEPWPLPPLADGNANSDASPPPPQPEPGGKGGTLAERLFRLLADVHTEEALQDATRRQAEALHRAGERREAAFLRDLPEDSALREFAERGGVIDGYGVLYSDPADPHVWTAAVVARLSSAEAAEAWVEEFRVRAADLVAAALACVTLLYYVVIYPHGGLAKAVSVLDHAILQEYIPFIVLLFSLYTISGGIRITGDLRAHPNANKPIGSGPFKFAEWRKGAFIRLDRNDNYWKDGQPYLDRIVARFIADPSTRTAALEKGEAHFAAMGAVPFNDAKKLAANPNLTITTKGHEIALGAGAYTT